jgi:hypothetical protein
MMRFLSRKNVKLDIMKTTLNKKLPKSYKIDPNLSDRYADEPIFVKKAKEANEILKRVGLPKGW